jgi:hypothetical protein
MIPAILAVAAEQNTSVVRFDRKPISFIDWVKGDNYHVLESTPAFAFTSHDPELLAGAFSSESLRLFLAGRETLKNIQATRAGSCIHPAWSAIQMYYCAFYYVSGMFRMLGFSHSYFFAGELNRPRNLLSAQGSSNLPGTGLYELRLSGNATSLSLEKTSGGSHEAVWKALRGYLDGLKSRVSGYGQFSSTDVNSIYGVADELIAASKGLDNNPNLSSTRNDVQYRQRLSSWHPHSRTVKSFHKTDRIAQIFSNYQSNLFPLCTDEYDDFLRGPFHYLDLSII